MSQISYPYYRLQSWRYVFVSDGKKKIQKIVDFVPLRQGNIINLGFGDLSPDGSIDDKANSNNGDIIKVLATVIDILKISLVFIRMRRFSLREVRTNEPDSTIGY